MYFVWKTIHLGSGVSKFGAFGCSHIETPICSAREAAGEQAAVRVETAGVDPGSEGLET